MIIKDKTCKQKREERESRELVHSKDPGDARETSSVSRRCFSKCFMAGFVLWGSQWARRNKKRTGLGIRDHRQNKGEEDKGK